MLFHAITGSWREAYRNLKIEQDVRANIVKIWKQGDGIVTGGAPGVDFYATDEMMMRDPSAAHVLVILPIPLSLLIAHFRARAQAGIILPEHKIEENICLLERIFSVNPDSVLCADFRKADKESYYARHNMILGHVSGDVYAYQVGGSQGTQDTIDKAIARGKKIHLYSYPDSP